MATSALCGYLPTRIHRLLHAADPKLTYWTKEEVPFLALPPPNMQLTAWRDPFVIGRPGQDGQDCWWVGSTRRGLPRG